MGNRVEDLEKQVAELQATIDGLTEELVETKERVRQLEDDDATGTPSTATTTTPTTESDGGEESRRENQHAEFVPNADRSEDVTPEPESADGDDGEGWRTAGEEESADGAAPDAAADDDVKSEDGEEANEDGDAEDDGDIIVA